MAKKSACSFGLSGNINRFCTLATSGCRSLSRARPLSVACSTRTRRSLGEKRRSTAPPAFESVDDPSSGGGVQGDSLRQGALVKPRRTGDAVQRCKLNRCDASLSHLRRKGAHRDLMQSANQVAWHSMNGVGGSGGHFILRGFFGFNFTLTISVLMALTSANLTYQRAHHERPRTY